MSDTHGYGSPAASTTRAARRRKAVMRRCSSTGMVAVGQLIRMSISPHRCASSSRREIIERLRPTSAAISACDRRLS